MQTIRYEEEISIGDILSRTGLRIPDYQRPYRWERKQIRHLFYDIREAIEKDTSVYRIGSVILHRTEDGQLDIVDGQQRLISISLFLLVYAKDKIPVGAKNLLEYPYQSLSRFHGKENYKEWEILSHLIMDEELAVFHDYLLHRCCVSLVEMPEDGLAEAFQLFDSQNNRGKKLEVHDLLKAYHLRSMGNQVSEEMIAKWENYSAISRDSGQLSLTTLFDNYLFRIRRWAVGDTGLSKRRNSQTRALVFNEDFIEDFKGVELEGNSYPYLELYKLLQENDLTFPYSLTMPIVNGETFFRYIEYSYDLINDLFYKDEVSEGYLEKNVLDYVTSKQGKYKKVVNLYQTILALFIDRFGEECLTREVCEKLFVWAFYLRSVVSRIVDSTQANYAASEKFRGASHQKLFQILANSRTPNDFISKIDMDLLDNCSSEELIKKL